MHMRLVSLLALGATSLVSASPTPQDDGSSGSLSAGLDQLAQLAQQAFQETQAIANGTTATKRSGTCTASNLKIRREWGALSAGERTAYIKAVKCLQSKPPRTPASAAPGAKSRFDDFVATHINQTLTIHYTGNFLGWHRYFTWLYEQALIQECGYTGTQPYWDWSKTAISGLTNSPIFDGSSTSMSGNGEAIPGLQPIVLNGPTPGLPALYLPPGNGGGCITSGPFKDMSVNLGPASLSQPGGTTATNPNGPLSYNPRCLKRSLTDEINRAFANASSIVANILQPNNVYDFEMQMQGVPGSGSIGVHGGGHYTIGGDPGDDVFVSPGDPIFYLHHGMIDRTWWIWQMLNPQQRVYSKNAVSGTNTFLNQPPSANTTLQDYVNYGFAAGPPRQLSDLMSTVDGPFCYLYL